MLRRSARAEIFAALFLETGRRGAGWHERNASVLAARRGRNTDAQQKTARGVVPKGCGGWVEYRGAVRRIQLLPHAADHCDSCAQTRRKRRDYRLGRIFRITPEPCAARAAVSQEPARDCTCGGVSRP